MTLEQEQEGSVQLPWRCYAEEFYNATKLDNTNETAKYYPCLADQQERSDTATRHYQNKPNRYGKKED